MRFVFEINHPAQVHLLRNLYFSLISKNHFVKIFAKNSSEITRLLYLYHIPFSLIGKKGKGITRKLLAQIWFDLKMFCYVTSHRISIGIGSSMTNDHVSAISQMRSIHLSDDDEDVVPLVSKYAYPYSDVILSPDCCKFYDYRKKNITYSGYHELAYLHPKRFVPDSTVISELGLKPGDFFSVMRFNSFEAHHDVGIKGLSLEQKKDLISMLSRYGRVFVTTEKKIETEISQYQLNISPDKIHSLLYYATIFLGDSQTMTSEAAVLGTPAIRCNSFVGRISYLEEQEHKYGLVYGFRPEKFADLLNKVSELLNTPDIKKEWQRRRWRMLSDKIDVTAFMIWFVENYPESERIMRVNPDFQYNFK